MVVNEEDIHLDPPDSSKKCFHPKNDSSQDKVSPAPPPKHLPNEYWISSLGLYEGDKEVLNSSCDYINDNIIQTAQVLLRKNFNLGGLQSPQCGKKMSFEVDQVCIQVLNVSEIHWVTISNIDVARGGLVSTDEVYVYDSLLPKKIPLHVKKQACCLLRNQIGKEVTFKLIDVMCQPNLIDCGLFALANLTELSYRGDPARRQWDVPNMRAHLKECFEMGMMQRFPIVKERRIHKRLEPPLIPDKIYCICKMPNDKSIPISVQLRPGSLFTARRR